MPRAKLTDAKTFPDNYPADAVHILEAMSFDKKVFLMGSMALRSQLYAGDYDGYEVVLRNRATDEEALEGLADDFKEIIRRLQKMKNVYIGDIKAGLVERWRVIPENGKVNVAVAKGKVRHLLAEKVITEAEAKKAISLLAPKTMDDARDFLKFHIVRWKPFEILAGKKTLRDGSTMTLAYALGCPTITKLDVIGFVSNNRYTDFSIIYEFYNKGSILNPVHIDIEKSLRDNLALYRRQGNYFKALKRELALAKLKDDRKKVARLTPLLNSDLGRLYQIISDIRTLTELLEHQSVPLETVRFEIDQFKGRLSNIYSLSEYLKKEPAFLKAIERILELPKGKLEKALGELADGLDAVLQRETRGVRG